VAAELGVPLTVVYGVATFYSAFSLVPRGRHRVQVCLGTACYVRGGANVADALARHLGTELGRPSRDFRFQLEPVRCLGCCSLAPVVRIDDRTFGRVVPRDVPRLVESAVPGPVPGAGETP
jgi:NADH:ubiquinone oxidoreductase subunit E